MKFPRRTFLHLAACAAALPVSRMARAQTYPSRPVRIIVGFPAGGATDIQARLMGQWLSDRLGQQFIVENRSGASGNIGTEAVAKAPADGYTLLQVVTPNVINAALYTNLNFDFMRDIAPVICSARLAYMVVVHPSVPATTIPEFIAYAKANPGKINMASAGNGTPQHVVGELFKMMAGDRHGPRPISGRSSRDHRPARRPSAGDFQSFTGVDRTHQSRETSPAGRDHRDPFGGVAGYSDRGGLPAGLRSERLARNRSPKKHTR